MVAFKRTGIIKIVQVALCVLIGIYQTVSERAWSELHIYYNSICMHFKNV
jgi:hypothetical protein